MYSLLNFLEHDFTIDSNHATEFRTSEANGNLGGHGSADEEQSPDQGFGLQGICVYEVHMYLHMLHIYG